jgi:hypothetical protein
VWKESSAIMETSQEIFRRMCRGAEGLVLLADKDPVENQDKGLGLNYHEPKYTFLIEKQWHEDQIVEKQYISLNFLFNSMRNPQPESRLIRGDDCFKALCENVCKILKCKVLNADVLAAEYAYYILLKNVVDELSYHDICKESFFDG